MQMIHASTNHSMSYMPNARNGAYPRMPPQSFSTAMAPLLMDANHASHIDAVIAPPSPSNNLTTALASAAPEQQQVVMIYPWGSYETMVLH